MKYAILKSDKDLLLSTIIGELSWSKEGNEIRVPLVLESLDSFSGKKQILTENWAQQLLDNYESLSLVRIEEDESVVQPTKKRGRPRKEKVT